MEKLRNSVVKTIFKIKTFTGESRIFIILTLLLLFPTSLFSQRKADIGIFAGTSYYMGDLNPVRHFYSAGYNAIGPIFRYNFEARNSVRFHAVYHKLQGNSAGYGDPYIESLNTGFQASFMDVAANYEINFIPYKTANRKTKQSLYLTAGFGYHLTLNSNVPLSKPHFTMPFGIGYKFNLAKKLSAGVEVTARKTFTDYDIDGVINIAGEKNNLFGNNDWYTFAGIFISYKIFSYREDCPAYGLNESKKIQANRKNRPAR